jgi:hypothetical protein
VGKTRHVTFWYILDMGIEIAVMGRPARIWEEYDSVLSSD